MHRRQFATIVLAAALAASWMGCNRPAAPKNDKKANDDAAAAAPGGAAEPAPEPKVEPPPKPTMPEVKLSDALAAECLVKVGDAMPEATLPDLAGKPTALGSLLGPKLTVVCFWKADNPYAVEELRDLAQDVAGPYEAKGVRVVGVNTGDAAEAAGTKARETGATFPNLIDADGAYFHKVATDKLPRTYLLDAEGKILWFDIEYSRSTRRDLLQAIDVTLEKE
ncbi:MAG: TlpA family protein disulfide reductase [Pirellulales bacterium]|nr:TlpA family protein disulfide reductase [Pirellulales bacterium]